jgi:uncharacterized protein (TIRG00374 family)
MDNRVDRRHKKTLAILLRACIAAALLVAVFRRVGLKAALSQFADLRKEYIIAAIAFYFLMYLVKCVRWRFLLKTQNMHLTFWRSLSVYIFSSLFGAFTPGRVGEAIRIIGPARDRGLYAESAACSAVDKGFDIALLVVLLGSASSCSLLSTYESTMLLALGVSGIFVLAIGLVVVRHLATRNVSIPAALLRFAPQSWNATIHGQPSRFFRAVVDCVSRGWFLGVVTTGAFWILHVACHFLILKALGGSMNMGYLVLCLVLSSIVEFVPVTVCGLGTREYLLIYLFGRVALPEELAVAFGLMNLVFTYLVTGLFMFAIWCLGGRRRDEVHKEMCAVAED